MRSALALVLAVAGCGATVDVYRYQPAPLPTGMAPQAALEAALKQMDSVEWSDGHRPIPPGRLQVTADATGINGTLILPSGRPIPQLQVAYREFPSSVRSVTCFDDRWTVHLADRQLHALDLRFPTRESARQFLDAATALGIARVASR